MRRAEFAVAAFGVTAFLLALIFILDAMRFHGDVLIDALEGLPRGDVHTQGALLISLALFDGYAVVRAVCSIWRGASAHRRIRGRMPVLDERGVAGRRVLVVPGGRPLAFCAGLLHPRVYVSVGALECLGEDELGAVVAHEAHHAARRDPLRILVARAIGDAFAVPVTVLPGLADALPFADGELDAAVVSLVLCSVPDQERALSELRRVLRSGGELRFYEHVIARRQPKQAILRLADRSGVWPALAAGCHLAQDAGAAIAEAGSR